MSRATLPFKLAVGLVPPVLEVLTLEKSSDKFLAT